MKTWLALCWWTWWCAVLPAQDPVGPAEVGASSAAKATGAPVEVVTAEAKVAAILAAHHAGRFDVAMAVAALADPEPGVATTAAAIVRHTWVVLPPELFAALSREPTAARVLLRELALAPRPAAAGFAAAQAEAQPSRSLAHRLWALAARGTPLTRSEGELVLANDQGRRVQPTIQIPPDATDISIGIDGTVSVMVQGETEPQDVGQLNLSTFINPAGLMQKGENIYVATDASGPPNSGVPSADGRGRVKQNYLENSNVDPTRELIELIRTQRAFEMNSQSIRSADESLRTISQLRR